MCLFPFYRVLKSYTFPTTTFLLDHAILLRTLQKVILDIEFIKNDDMWIYNKHIYDKLKRTKENQQLSSVSNEISIKDQPNHSY